MSEIKRIRQLWPRLSKCQTLLIAVHARWLLYSDAYVALPYTLRRWAFNWSARALFPAHWVR